MSNTSTQPTAPVPAYGERTRELLTADERHRSGLFDPDVVFVRGDGANLYDADGRRYLDFMAGIAVASVGHANPRLAAALAEQAQRLIVCPQNLGNDTRTALSDALFEYVRPPLQRVFYSNSGTEANEAALKWARVATGRRRFVAMKRGFSGRTMGVLPLTWEPAYREPYAPHTVEVEFVTLNDADELRRAVTDDVAAVLLEPIQGESGINPATDEYLALARRLTRDAGALLVFDEVMTGFRVGWGGAQGRYGVRPDLTTLGKVIGGGMPVGAYGGRREIMEQVSPDGPVYQAGTLSGNPLAMACGLATLEVLSAPGAYERLEASGRRLAEGLREAASRHGVASQVHQAGSMLCAFFAEGPVRDDVTASASDTARYGRYFQGMLRRGVYLAPSQFEAMFVGTAHEDEDIAATLVAADESLKELSAA